jgi:hypothetical protein
LPYSTLEDLSALAKQQIANGKLDGEQGAKAALRNYDFREQFMCNNGWNISAGEWNDTEGQPLTEIWKTGAVGGFGSLMVLYPHQNSSIIILSNQPAEIERITTDLSHLVSIADKKADIEVPKNELFAWEGLYHIPAWQGFTFSISTQGDKSVFRTSHPIREELVLSKDEDNKDKLSFLWGSPKEPHYLLHNGKEWFLQIPNKDDEGHPLDPILVKIQKILG